MSLRPFHIAIPSHDLSAARSFYGGLLGFAEARSAPRWVDYDMRGHQLSIHLVDEAECAIATNPVDGDEVPARHFGIVLSWDDWQAWSARLTEAGVSFLIAPRIRFRGEPGEQATMFLRDPSGNVLEFKAFQDDAQLFATG